MPMVCAGENAQKQHTDTESHVRERQGEMSQDTCYHDPNPRIVLGILIAGTFLAPLDSSIVNIALPAIAADYGASMTSVGWVATAYLLTNASLVLSMGRLGDIWGLRRVYVAGFVVFGTGSLACAVSPSLIVLILSRVVQAVGASMMFAAGPALVTRAFPPETRGRALGWISLSVSAGLTVGPSLGGFLLGALGWQAVFLINIPLSIIVAVAAARKLPKDCPEPEAFDLVGALLGAIALTLLLLAFSATEHVGLFSGLVMGLLAAAIVAGWLFVRTELTVPHPTLDFGLFQSRTFRAGVGSAVLAYMALFAVTFTMPFYLLRVLGIDPAVAGLLLTATPLSMAVFSPVAGRLSDKYGSRGLTTGGLSVLASALLAASFFGAATSTVTIGIVLVAVGTGLSFFGAPNSADVLRATPRTRVGVGSALIGQARNLGMTLGIATTAAIIAAGLDGAALMDSTQALNPAEALQFVSAMRPAFIAAAVIAVVGAAVSWSRGAHKAPYSG